MGETDGWPATVSADSCICNRRESSVEWKPKLILCGKLKCVGSEKWDTVWEVKNG